MGELHSYFTAQCHRPLDTGELCIAPLICGMQWKGETAGQDYSHFTDKYPRLTKWCSMGSGNKAPAPSTGERLLTAQPGTSTLCWSDAAIPQEINPKVLTLPVKYQQGCGWAALAGSANPRPESLPNPLSLNNAFDAILIFLSPSLQEFMGLPHLRNQSHWVPLFLPIVPLPLYKQQGWDIPKGTS